MNKEIDLDNPWTKLSVPSDETGFIMRRVDADSWDLFWAINFFNNRLLIIEYSESIEYKDKLPDLRGLDIISYDQSKPGKKILGLCLLELENSDIFYQLCRDICLVAKQAKTEKDAVQSFLEQTWRWHRMLDRGSNLKLSREEQKGLIAEFYVLEYILFPRIGIDFSLKAWNGPFGTAKDFEMGKVSLEVKAKMSSSNSEIIISSAKQLDKTGIDKLYLHVSEVEEEFQPNIESFTVIDIAEKVKNKILNKYPSMLDVFLEKLCLVGLDLKEDYSEYKWLYGSHTLYEVKENFPRIIPEMYSEGVDKVHYSISLEKCNQYISEIGNFEKDIVKNE